MDLPLSYTELYGLAKSPHASAAAAEGAATGQDTDPAVCLVCGQVSRCCAGYGDRLSSHSDLGVRKAELTSATVALVRTDRAGNGCRQASVCSIARGRSFQGRS